MQHPVNCWHPLFCATFPMCGYISITFVINARCLQRSFFRTVLMKGFHFLVWFFCARSVRDTQCGFKLFTRDTVKLLFRNLHVDRWLGVVLCLVYMHHYLKHKSCMVILLRCYMYTLWYFIGGKWTALFSVHHFSWHFVHIRVHTCDVASTCMYECVMSFVCLASGRST